MDEQRRPEVPEDVRDGDVLVYMSGRLLVVDHLVPEAWTIDLVELHGGGELPSVPTSDDVVPEQAIDLRDRPPGSPTRDPGAT